MSFLRKPAEEPRIDLTPMVDVVFLLLIFFMISTTFVESPGITIKLPESSAQTIEREPQEIKVYLSSGGDLYYRDQLITLDQFSSLLAESRPDAAKTTVLLLADQKAQHGKVVALMDLARDAGFTRLAIATEQRKK